METFVRLKNGSFFREEGQSTFEYFSTRLLYPFFLAEDNRTEVRRKPQVLNHRTWKSGGYFREPIGKMLNRAYGCESRHCSQRLLPRPFRYVVVQLELLYERFPST